YPSDVPPTALQAVDYAAVPQGGSVTVLCLGPIADMCAHRPASRATRRRRGPRPVTITAHRRAWGAHRRPERLGSHRHPDHQGCTDGRGIDAVDMEAHGSPIAS